MYTNMAIKITKIAYWAFPKFYTVHSKIALILSSSVYTSLNITTHSQFTLSGRSPAFLTCDYFIRSNEIIRTKWPIYVVIGHFVLMI